MRLKIILYFLPVIMLLNACNSDIKKVQNIGDGFYAYLQQGNLNMALSYTSYSWFIRDTARLRSLQKNYGKIISYHRKETTILNDQKILYNNDTFLVDIAVLDYKVNYDKTPVNERLVLYKLKQFNGKPNFVDYKIYYYQSGYDKINLNN